MKVGGGQKKESLGHFLCFPTKIFVHLCKQHTSPSISASLLAVVSIATRLSSVLAPNISANKSHVAQWSRPVST